MTQELSVDSTQLPRYVEIMSDTLRLAEDAFAYAVQLRSIPPGKHYSENALYFVANVADSLYYRRLQSFNGARSSGTSMKIRGLRRLDVPNARATYVWIETEKQSVDRREEAPPTTRVKWRGHVLTHDRQRGMRYLSNAPIRAERTVDGETVGMEQWDIAVPEPGIMEVTVREYHGERVVLAPLSWIGPHVIDSSAVADTSRYRYLLEESEIWQR